MSNSAAKRIMMEFKLMSWNFEELEMAKCGIKLEMVDGSWSHLRGEILGPRNTPYEGGKFHLEILIPEGYPLKPPKVKFLTKIWHPNISSMTGDICDDILNQWLPSMTLLTILYSLQAMLAFTEPIDYNFPQDVIVAQQYKNETAIFKNTARYWTAKYAQGPNNVAEYETKLSHLVEMGVDEDLAFQALSEFNWEMESACLYFGIIS